MITIGDVCGKISVSPVSIGDIPLNIPITVLQQSNNSNHQHHFARSANYSDDQIMATWIWGIQCTSVSTPYSFNTKYFVEWNDAVHVFDMDSNPVKELVFNAIFYNDYHK
jgi:hypothetical protein